MSQDELIKRDEQSRARALDVGTNILCAAPAGSGKTELLVQRALASLAVANHPEEVLLLTFTTRAAAEIRERLVAALKSAAGPEPEARHARRTWQLAKTVAERDLALEWQVARNPGRFRAMTLDALSNLIASQAPVASGMAGSATVANDPAPIYRDAVLNLLDEINTLSDGENLEALASVFLIAQNRSERLVEVLSAMLAKRDQWLGLVQSGKHFDAGVMVRPIIESRLRQLDLLLPDKVRMPLLEALHGASKLDREVTDWPSTQAEELPIWASLAASLVTARGDLRKTVDKRAGFPAGEPFTDTMKAVLGELALMPNVSLLGQALSEVADLPSLELLGPVEGLGRQIGQVLIRLVAHLNLEFIRAGAVDFQEVARRALGALGDESGASPLLERLDYQIRHILLDEAQDTSSAQYDLLSALTLGWEPQDGRSLFIVGDPQQSIYGFREAEVRLFIEMWAARRFGSIPLECVILNHNFRSDAAVVEWCNGVFSKVFPEIVDIYSGSVTHAPSLSVRGDQGGSVTVHWFRGLAEESEANDAVSVIRQALKQQPDQSIGVLARNRGHVLDTLSAFRAAGIGVACKDIDPLSKTPAVGDVIGLVRALWHEQDRVSWAIFLRAPFVGLSYADLLAVTRGQTSGSWLAAIRERIERDDSGISVEGRARLKRVLDVLDSAMSDADLVSDLHNLALAVWITLGGPACVTAAEAEDVRSTFRLLREHLVGGRLINLREFLAALDHLYAGGEAGAVQVMTMHGAKGLEFDTVLLVGLGRAGRQDDPPLLAYRHTREGTLMVPFPSHRAGEGHRRLYRLAQNLNARAGAFERLRLLYVACTRARNHLHLFGTFRDGKQPGPETGSLLASLWPALSSMVDPSVIPLSRRRLQDSDGRCPTSPRIRLAWRPAVESTPYVPPMIHALRPSELVVRGELEQTGEDEAITQRLIGTAYHETIAFLLNRGLARRFEEMLDRIVPPMRAGLRRRGMPEPELNGAVMRVLDLVRITLSSEDGQNIIRRREEEGNEYRITGFIDGNWVSAVIDRYYVEDDTCWVVDYKAGGAMLAGEALDRLIAEDTERYRPQVLQYMDLMREMRGLRTRGGLFFVAAGRFIEV